MFGARQVSYEEGLMLARTWGVPFMETSAKRGINVGESSASSMLDGRGWWDRYRCCASE